MNMASRKSRTELLDAQRKRRNATRVEMVKDRMGAEYLLHPENKGVSWGWRVEG